MRFSTLTALVAVAASATAQTISGQYDCEPAGAYTLCQNLWGKSTYDAFIILLWSFMLTIH